MRYLIFRLTSQDLHQALTLASFSRLRRRHHLRSLIRDPNQAGPMVISLRGKRDRTLVQIYTRESVTAESIWRTSVVTTTSNKRSPLPKKTSTRVVCRFMMNRLVLVLQAGLVDNRFHPVSYACQTIASHINDLGGFTLIASGQVMDLRPLAHQ